jgi:hypothetical protein
MKHETLTFDYLEAITDSAGKFRIIDNTGYWLENISLYS